MIKNGVLIWCEKCKTFHPAKKVTGSFGKKKLECTNCGRKVNLKSLESKACEQCGNTYYAAKGRFGISPMCPSCGGKLSEAAELPEEESAQVPEEEAVQPVISNAIIEGVHCPHCFGPLHYFNGQPYCPNDNIYINPAEVQRQKMLLAQQSAAQNSAQPQIIQWPVNAMRNSRRLILAHGWGENPPFHSVISVAENQMMIYGYLGGTMYKTTGAYPFFCQNMDDPQMHDALYNGDTVNLVQYNSSVLFVNLLSHESDLCVPGYRFSYKGKNNVVEAEISYQYRITNPKQLNSCQFTLDPSFPDYLDRQVFRWCRNALVNELNAAVSDIVVHFDPMDNEHVTNILDYINEKLNGRLISICQAANRITEEKYGISIENVTKATLEQYCPVCKVKTRIEITTGDTAVCKGAEHHQLKICPSCGLFGIEENGYQCHFCGIHICPICGMPLKIISGEKAICTGNDHHVLFMCPECKFYTVYSNKCVIPSCDKIHYSKN